MLLTPRHTELSSPLHRKRSHLTAIPALVVVNVLLVVVPFVIAERLPHVVVPAAVLDFAPPITHKVAVRSVFNRPQWLSIARLC